MMSWLFQPFHGSPPRAVSSPCCCCCYSCLVVLGIVSWVLSIIDITVIFLSNTLFCSELLFLFLVCCFVFVFFVFVCFYWGTFIYLFIYLSISFIYLCGEGIRSSDKLPVPILFFVFLQFHSNPLENRSSLSNYFFSLLRTGFLTKIGQFIIIIIIVIIIPCKFFIPT